MRQLNNRAWWMLVVVAVLIALAWPSNEGKSLAVKFVNWAVDPRNDTPSVKLARARVMPF